MAAITVVLAACSGASPQLSSRHAAPAAAPARTREAHVSHAPPAPALPAPRAMLAFADGAPIRFRRGAPLVLSLLLRDARPLALSPDARIFAANDGEKLVVLVDGKPVWHEDAAASTLASFSADGSLLAVYDGTVRVHDSRSGKLLYEADGAPCALRFTSNDELWFHGEASSASDWKGSLEHMHVAARRIEAVGPARWAESCSATPDATRWLVTEPKALELVGRDGAGRVLVQGDDDEIVVSPAGDRYCFWRRDAESNGEVACARIADGTVERIGAVAYPELLFDPDGKRALYSWSADLEGDVHREYAILDFSTHTRRTVVGFSHKSGSMPGLCPGGELLSMGSSSGMYVYDLERGVVRFAAHRPLYANYPMAGHARRLIAGAESPGGGASEDLYLLVVP